MLTLIASGYSGTASDSSNIGCTVVSLVGGAIGSTPGPVASGQIAVPGATAIAGAAGKVI